MAALCARYGISRRVGYKFARYAEEGRRGQQDRRRAPPRCPHRIGEATAELLCELRRAHPYWGARKLLAVLARRHPTIETVNSVTLNTCRTHIPNFLKANISTLPEWATSGEAQRRCSTSNCMDASHARWFGSQRSVN